MGRTGEKKRARRTKPQREEDEKPDRLSDLPDAIIHQILSFTELKYAIQTSVLSKRWKHLWVSLPDLKFDDEGFTYSRFTKFVRKVLSNVRADCNICKFKLDSGFKLDNSLVKRIFNYLVSHNVQHLDICVGPGATDYLCSFRSVGSFLTCNTLKTLKLEMFGFQDLAESFSFGFTMLTSMNLSHCEFHYEIKSGSADLFASLPNLKNLSLEACDFSSVKVLKISGLQLLTLKIELCLIYDYGITYDSNIETFAPKLTTFYFEGSNYFSSVDIPSLCYADIWLSEYLVQEEKFCLGLFSLFRGLYNAEVIKLSGMTIKYLNRLSSLKEQQPAPFKRLKSLKVKCDGMSLAMPNNVKKYLAITLMKKPCA